MVYFNEMNLAVKSPMLSKPQLGLSAEMMWLLTHINSEYDKYCLHSIICTY